MEGLSLIVERQRMAGTLHPMAQHPIGKFKGPNPFVDAPSHLLDWQAIGSHGVPQSEKADARDGLVARRYFRRKRFLWKRVEDLSPMCVEFPLTVSLVGRSRPTIEFRLRRCVHQSLIQDEAHNDANRECPAAEPEAEDLVRGVPVVSTDELVNIDYISPEAISK